MWAVCRVQPYQIFGHSAASCGSKMRCGFKMRGQMSDYHMDQWLRGTMAVTTRTRTQNDDGYWKFPEQGGILLARTTVMHPVTSERLSTLEDHEEQLLPRLSNAIVLENIVPKVPWMAFYALSSVNRSWRQAIGNHQVYDARARSQATETFIVLDFCHSFLSTRMGVHAICLYSVRDKTWHRLPDFPHKSIVRGIPNGCGCVSLDSKIYVLGGETEEDYTESGEVYVFDLAGQTAWRQCANMLEPRKDFATGVIHGKMYVFGGTSHGKTIVTSEVYDPEENAWSSVTPMISRRSKHQAVTLGEEFWVYGGMIHDQGGESKRDELFAQVYRPGKDEWELVKLFKFPHPEALFAANGELHSMYYDGIRVYDCDDDEDSWAELYSFEFEGVEFRYDVAIEPFAAYVVNGELFALVDWLEDEFEVTLIQSKGFGMENDKIVWEKVNCPFTRALLLPDLGAHCAEPFMCLVQL